jgi:hypothetical protein
MSSPPHPCHGRGRRRSRLGRGTRDRAQAGRLARSQLRQSERVLKDVGHLDDLDEAQVTAKALAFKEVLSLFLAQCRPAFYLQENREALKQLTKSAPRRCAA